MHNKTIAELTAGLKAGDFSSVELTQACLDRINSLDEQLNSFITVTPELALEQARLADEQRAAGNAGILKQRFLMTTKPMEQINRFRSPLMMSKLLFLLTRAHHM